jgi:hypothetical protein
MGIQATDRFQGLCLLNVDGAGIAFMDIYNKMPEEAQKLVQKSTHNVCLVCLQQMAIELSGIRNRYLLRTSDYARALAHMEEQISISEGNGV